MPIAVRLPLNQFTYLLADATHNVDFGAIRYIPLDLFWPIHCPHKWNLPVTTTIRLNLQLFLAHVKEF